MSEIRMLILPSFVIKVTGDVKEILFMKIKIHYFYPIKIIKQEAHTI